MRVQHNIAAMNSYRNFGINNSKMAKNLEKLSSGFAVNRAGDDAAGLAVSEKMRAQITGLEGAQKNAKDGIGMIQTAEGALTEVHDMLNRMYSLTEQAANETYDATDRTNLDMEVQALKEEINRIGTTSSFNGMKLFAASGSTIVGKKLAIGDIADGSDNMLSLAFAGVGGELSTGVLNTTNLSIDTLAISAGATSSDLTSIKNAINSVSAFRGKLGAYQNRLEHTINNLGVMRENIQDAESRIRDTDVAEEMMKFTKNNIMNQASQAMLAQANQLPQGVLQLLQ